MSKRLSCLPRPTIETVKSAMSVFVHLAISIVADLGLAHPLQTEPSP